jgi:uncharacterized cupredoxin-like copper-binding protein
MRKLMVFASGVALVFGALSSSAAPAAAASTNHVGVTLREMSITLTVTSVPTGSVTFDITNAGTVEHEFVILKTDIAPDALPANLEEPGKAAEIGHVDERDPVTGTVSLTIDNMRPGWYVLVCNKPGHYIAGMFAALHVLAPANITVPMESRSAAAAEDATFAAQGVEDLEDVDARVDVTALLKAPGIKVTDADTAAINAGIFPRGVGPDGSLLYFY